MLQGIGISSSKDSKLRSAAEDSCRRLIDSEGYTDLHLAIHLQDHQLLQLLLSQCHDVNVQDKFQRTALMLAVLKDDFIGARSLLKAQANVKQQDYLGMTPLAMATERGHHHCIFLLMQFGAKCTLQTANHQGTRPIHTAASTGDLFMVKLLTKLQCNVMLQDHEQKSALDHAVTFGHGEIVEFLKIANVHNPSINKDVSMQAVVRNFALEDGLGSGSETKGHHTGPNRRELKVIFRVVLKGLLQKLMYPDQITRRVVPFFCHCACACAVLEHVVASRSLRQSVLPKTSIIFEVSVPAILVLTQYIIRMDLGPPQSDGIKDFMLLASELPVGELPKIKQLCTTTWILKGLRTKYCTFTGSCIEEFDHFCILLNVPIGKKNHRPFLFLMCLEVISQPSHCALCLCTLGHSGVRFGAMQHPVVTGLLVVHIATVPGICLLILVQMVLISFNLTMNEVLHMHRYEHFWSKEQQFTNPFSKGNIARNCFDFWWTRARGRILDISTKTDSGWFQKNGKSFERASPTKDETIDRRLWRFCTEDGALGSRTDRGESIDLDRSIRRT